jgi:hypothetical protein
VGTYGGSVPFGAKFAAAGERRKPMERDDVRRRLDAAVTRLVHDDGYLFANNLGERCIASRLAMYLQHEFPEHAVDAEYNRDGGAR